MSTLLRRPVSGQSLLHSSGRSQAAWPSAAGGATGADQPSAPQASACGLAAWPSGTVATCICLAPCATKAPRALPQELGDASSSLPGAELAALMLEGLLGSHERVRGRTSRLAERLIKSQEGLLWLVARLPGWLPEADARPRICQDLFCLAAYAIASLPSGLPQVWLRPRPGKRPRALPWQCCIRRPLALMGCGALCAWALIALSCIQGHGTTEGCLGLHTALMATAQAANAERSSLDRAGSRIHLRHAVALCCRIMLLHEAALATRLHLLHCSRPVGSGWC